MKKSRLIISIVFFALTLATTVLIIVNAAINGETSAAMSNGLTAFIMRVLHINADESKFAYFIRKSLGHFMLNGFNAGFLTLGLFFYMKDKIKHRALLLVTSFGYGVLIAAISELIQLFTDGRTGAMSDVGINSLGCLTFILIIGLVYSIKWKVQNKESK